MSASELPAPASAPLPLQGLRVVCFESRRSAESSRLIARQGGEPVEAPTLREVPLREAGGIAALEAELEQRAPLLLILLTGVGTELLIEGLSQSHSPSHALELLRSETTTIVCRGPKPHAVLKPLGIKPALVIGEPNTWRDVLAGLDADDTVRGRSVYVQEYGRTNEELMRGLAERGASRVCQVKTYAWALPEDLSPLHQAIERIARGEADVALFTSGVQVTHLLEVAEASGATERLRAGLARCVIASIGPLTSEALRSAGLSPDVEPEHPKLGHLMVALAAQAAGKLAEKRGARS